MVEGGGGECWSIPTVLHADQTFRTNKKITDLQMDKVGFRWKCTGATSFCFWNYLEYLHTYLNTDICSAIKSSRLRAMTSEELLTSTVLVIFI
jgi:hypothetical protein